MTAHPSFKLHIDNQLIELDTLEDLDLKSPWQTSIINFVSDFLSDKPIVNVQTSGSSGKPKQISLLKLRMRNSAEITGDFLKLKENDTALLCLSPDYIAGKMMLVRAMILGLDIYCIEPKKEFLQNLNLRFAFSAMVPLQAIANKKWLSKIDKLIIGGGSLSQRNIETLIQTHHKGLYQTFGMTETISHVALKRLSEPFYSGLKNISFSLSSNKTLVIGAPHLLDEPITTNDLVELKSNTAFQWLGRIDNIINSGAHKIIPEKVESIIGKILDVPFFVFGIQDECLGEKLILCIENEKSPIDLELLRTLELNRFEIPKEIYTTKQFIRTETGKIQRKKTIASLSLT